MQTTDLIAEGLDWIITVDHLNECELSKEAKDEAKAKYPHAFRIYDGDDTLYYEGFSLEDSSFEPLDEYAMPNDGATDIQYFNTETNRWETL